MAEKKIGVVTHFFDKISVAAIKLDGALNVGDRVKFATKETPFEQDITEMQVEHAVIPAAKKGQEIGVKVSEKVKQGDEVFLLK
jgi:hypothetical protein